jgi:YidC/Oxa1 family membrane protein insertase
MTFTKTFTVDAEAYSVRMKLKMIADVSKGGFTQQLTVTTFAYNDPKADTKSSMQVAAREWASSTYRDGEILNTPMEELKHEEKGPLPRFEPNITWTGFEHPYLLVAYAPRKVPGEAIAKHTYPLDTPGLMRTDIEFPKHVFDGKHTELEREIYAYLGPKNYDQLTASDARAGFETEFSETIDFGWFAFIGRPLAWLLIKFHGFTGNWALAIILLTFLVKGATLYWTTKSMRSMKQMAALAPQMKALQEKYKNDRARIQAETMALYKTHNVNPVAGCLPILLQMPIWIALYRMLSSAGELYQEPFISGWIDDLTNTDPFYVLPFILLVTMFVQARLTPVSGDSRQQKFMIYGMPLMFGVMSFFFPAGLTLYIFTNTVLSALHSIYMNKYDKKSLAIAAQLKASAEAAKAAEAKPAAKAKPVPSAKPVIDVDVVESKVSDGESDGDTNGEAKSSGTASRPHQQRKKKKRRR